MYATMQRDDVDETVTVCALPIIDQGSLHPMDDESNLGLYKTTSRMQSEWFTFCDVTSWRLQEAAVISEESMLVLPGRTAGHGISAYTYRFSSTMTRLG